MSLINGWSSHFADVLTSKVSSGGTIFWCKGFSRLRGPWMKQRKENVQSRQEFLQPILLVTNCLRAPPPQKKKKKHTHTHTHKKT